MDGTANRRNKTAFFSNFLRRSVDARSSEVR